MIRDIGMGNIESKQGIRINTLNSDEMVQILENHIIIFF